MSNLYIIYNCCFSSGQNGSWVDGSTDFTDFHGIFTDIYPKIRENPVKIREIRTSINPLIFCPILRLFLF
jgi:hypothetical protein